MKLSPPEQCHLWQKDSLVVADLSMDDFTIVEDICDDEHDIRKLLQCNQCGQRYFYEFHEEIDWVNGNDPQYRTYVPVQTDEEIRLLKQTDYWFINSFYPRLQWNWSSDNTHTIMWIGR
jgi:hypothetical protein